MKNSKISNYFRIFGFVFLIFYFLFLMLAPESALAQAQWMQGMELFRLETGLADVPLPIAIGRIVKIVLAFLGLIAVVIIIAGGFIWMTSGGVPEKINKAKKIMLAGSIGLGIIVLSYAIASFIVSLLWGQLGPGADWVGPGVGPGTLPTGATYLVIIDKHPKNNQSVVRNTTITIIFNRALNCDTVKYGAAATDTIKITKAGTLVSGHLRVSGNTLTFKTKTACTGTALAGLACQNNSCPRPGQSPDFVCHIGTNANPQCAQLSPSTRPLSCCPAGAFCCGCLDDGSYTITLTGGSAGIKAQDGKEMPSGGASWSFTVTPDIDVNPPKVEIRAPVPNSTGVPRNVGMAVTFSKPIDPSTLKAYATSCTNRSNCVTNIDDASVQIRIGATPVSGFFERITTQAFIFRPDSTCADLGKPNCKCFEANKNIAIILLGTGADPEKAIRDLNCNVLDCSTASDCQWNFTTSADADFDPPVVDLVDPPDRSENVDRLTKLTGTFNEPIDPTSVNFDTFVLNGVEPLSIEGKGTPEPPVKRFVLTPFPILDAFRDYQAVIFGNAGQSGTCDLGGENIFGVRDLAGNPLRDNKIWTFKTGGLIGGPDPRIQSITPNTGPEGTCATIIGFNLGCCPEGTCPTNQTPADYYWDFPEAKCHTAPTSPVDKKGKIEILKSGNIWTTTVPLSWEELERSDQCRPEPQEACKNNYSPKSQIIIQVPTNTASTPNNIKITPAHP